MYSGKEYLVYIDFLTYQNHIYNYDNLMIFFFDFDNLIGCV